MRNFISDDDVERAILDKLGKAPFNMAVQGYGRVGDVA